MKKVLALTLAVLMTVSLLCVPAFAAGSKTELVEETAVVGATVTESTAPEVTKEEITEAVAALTEDEQKTFTDALAELGLDSTAVEMTVVSQKDVEITTAGQKATMTITMEGVDDTTTVVVAVWLKLADGTMKLIGVGKLPLDIELEESGTLIVAMVE